MKGARNTARLIAAVMPLAAGALLAQNRPAARAGRAPFSFVVLGHIRGGHQYRLNPKLPEILARTRALHPDFIVLGGDAIWGDVDSPTGVPRKDVVTDEWNAVDSALATTGVPIYRTPGNHDITDVQSRDIWWQRYGSMPKVIAYHGSRVILLASAFIPPNGDTTHMKYIGGVDVDSSQLAWLRQTLTDTGYAHTFVVMHHLLWWELPQGRWWREVHPVLAAAHVEDVFSGDYGPMKFSTMQKDGVRYWQGSIELETPIDFLRRNINSRLLASQFDTFMEVRVAGDSVNVVVHTADEVSSGDFTPEHYRALQQEPKLTLMDHWRILAENRSRLAGLGLLSAGMLVVGAGAGWWLGRRR
ncbi:MAG TPA: metallophosphoesterase [Gemmatimonadales bacterium]|jgi:hypothetical protein